MGIINNMPSKSGMDINGVIKDYYVYAGENISAGSFVEFIRGTTGDFSVGASSWKTIDGTTGSSTALSAVELNNGNVFLAHASNSTDYKLYGMIVVIDGSNIVPGNNVELAGSGTGYYSSAVVLDNERVAIFHNSDATNYYLSGLICKINGTTIEVGTDKQLSTSKYTGTYLSTILLEVNKVIVTHGYSSDYGLYGSICDVSSNIIALQQSAEIWNSYTTAHRSHMVKLSNTKVFVSYTGDGDRPSTSSYSGDRYLNGVIVTINGTSISRGNPVTIDNGVDSSFHSICALNQNTLFVVYTEETYREPLYARVINIGTDNTITIGAQTTIDASTNGPGYYSSVVALSETKACVFYSDEVSWGTETSVSALICDISGTTITPSTKLSSITTGGAISGCILVLLKSGNLFFTCNNNNKIDGQLFSIDETNNIPTNNVKTYEFETQVRNATTESVNGLATTSGVGGSITHNQQVKIAVPNI